MSDDEPDPFERLGDVGDRDGDPFERLEDGDAGDDSDPLGDSADNAGADGDTHDSTPADRDGEASEEASADRSGADDVVEMDEPTVDPGSDGQGGVDRQAGDPFENGVFEEMDVGELDPDEVWASVADAEERGSVSRQPERAYADVSKHRYCEQCEFFSDPPDVACSHDGTEILEFRDQETVRVVDCPVVAEREQLERHE